MQAFVSNDHRFANGREELRKHGIKGAILISRLPTFEHFFSAKVVFSKLGNLVIKNFPMSFTYREVFEMAN